MEFHINSDLVEVGVDSCPQHFYLYYQHWLYFLSFFRSFISRYFSYFRISRQLGAKSPRTGSDKFLWYPWYWLSNQCVNLEPRILSSAFFKMTFLHFCGSSYEIEVIIFPQFLKNKFNSYFSDSSFNSLYHFSNKLISYSCSVLWQYLIYSYA